MSTQFYPRNRKEWRAWLQQNHSQEQEVWLLYYKTKSGVPSVTYNEAVEEALCFGWIDSKVLPIDEKSYQQFFCKRKPTSVWSKLNKERIAKLSAQNLIAEAGKKSIEIAKQNGSWTILDDAESLVIPEALQQMLNAKPEASTYFGSLSRSTKRNILQWITLAKTPLTRQKRIAETAALALQKTVPKQFRVIR